MEESVVHGKGENREKGGWRGQLISPLGTEGREGLFSLDGSLAFLTAPSCPCVSHPFDSREFLHSREAGRGERNRLL